jgi:hypothetical protein
VEATKFTEVGYHGRDVDTIIRDLVEAAIVGLRQRLRAAAKAKVGGRRGEVWGRRGKAEATPREGEGGWVGHCR